MLIFLNKGGVTHAQAGKKGPFFSVLIDLFLTKASNLCIGLVLPRLISRGIREIGNESLYVMYNFE